MSAAVWLLAGYSSLLAGSVDARNVEVLREAVAMVRQVSA